MSYRVEFHEGVSEDYSEAYIHYEMIREGLGERFITSVRKKIRHPGGNSGTLR